MSEIAARPLDPDATPVGRSPASRRIKVLVLIPDLAIGGAETDLLRTLPLIDRDRLEVVVCVIEARGALAAPLSEAGIQVIGPFADETAEAKPLDRALLRIDAMARRLAPGWPVFRLMRLALHYMRIARMVKRVLDEGRFDVVHTMSPSSYVIGALATGFARHRALVMSRVSLNFYQHGARLLGTVERLLHRRLDLAIANAEAILGELGAEGIPASRLRLIRNGIDSAAFTASLIDRGQARARLGLPQAGLIFTSVANLFPYKGHADLLQALQTVRDELPAGWVLLVCGRDIEGSLQGLRRLAEGHALAGHVRFLGQRQDIPAILSSGDIHVSASHYEGFPNNILEAMCAGLPVVATAVGGVPEQIIDGATGLLVPPRNPTALGAALVALARDASRRQQLGQAGRRRVEQQYRIGQAATGLELAYESAARSRRKSRVQD